MGDLRTGAGGGESAAVTAFWSAAAVAGVLATDGDVDSSTCFPPSVASRAAPDDNCLAIAVAAAWSGPLTITWPFLMVMLFFPSSWIPTTVFLFGVAGCWPGWGGVLAGAGDVLGFTTN